MGSNKQINKDEQKKHEEVGVGIGWNNNERDVGQNFKE